MPRNGLQMTGFTEELMAQRDLCAKAAAFGWDTMTIEDGNDIAQVCAALEKLPERDYTRRGAPLFIVSNTVKGKGVRNNWTKRWPPLQKTERRCEHGCRKNYV